MEKGINEKSGASFSDKGSDFVTNMAPSSMDLRLCCRQQQDEEGKRGVKANEGEKQTFYRDLYCED